MTVEIIQYVVETDENTIENIFSDKKISPFFDKGFKETVDLIRSIIEQYKKGLYVSLNSEAERIFIPNDDELIMKEFKKTLKMQIFGVALSETVSMKKFNIEKNILELTEPINMIQFFSSVTETVFNKLIKAAHSSDDSVNKFTMMS